MHVEGSLEKYLKSEIFPQISPPPYGAISATRLSSKIPVYLFHDETSQVKVVGKTFQYGGVPFKTAWERAELEYSNLKMARDRYGMCEGLHRVVAPLGKNKDLSALLVTEYATGNTLDHYIIDAINKLENQKLFDKLKNLAHFLNKLHSNSESENHPSEEVPKKYLKNILHSLHHSLLTSDERALIHNYSENWWSSKSTFHDHEVIVHGDATPTNFIFHHKKVTGIDLEKMKYADRCWDLGFITAELKHHFIWRGRNGWEAEPFISHFLWEYAAHRQDAGFFKSITHRLPLYMALGLLRITRNTWLENPHRRNLVKEAMLCLKYKT